MSRDEDEKRPTRRSPCAVKVARTVATGGMGRRTVRLCVLSLPTYVNGQRKRERIGSDKRLAETVLRKRKVEIAEGKSLERKRPITTTLTSWPLPTLPVLARISVPRTAI